MRRWSLPLLARSAAATALFALVPIVTGDDAALYFVMLVMIWSVFALGYDIVFGVTGMLSFGHAAFFGTGAYAASHVMMSAGLGFGPALLVAGLAGALMALAFSVVALRMSGIYLGLTTLMLAELVYVAAAVKLRALSGGADGIPGVPRPMPGGLDGFENPVFYWVVLGVFALALAASEVLRSSPLGQVLRAVRQNSVRVAHLGFTVNRFRMAAFAVSGAYAGVAGALLASLMMYVGPQNLHWKVSGDVLIMTVLGGSGTLLGPVLGVAVVEALRELLSAYTQYWYGLVGLIFILCTLYLPQGLAGLGSRLRAVALRPASSGTGGRA